MTRANDRILCRDCRYNISERCYLNNPQGRTIVWTSFDQLQPGCFSGCERRVRSCMNCWHRETLNCLLEDRWELHCNTMPEGWHCSKWEAPE